jgi:S-adenosylmethionine/arginine decarboxylase-like enzyme
MVQIYNPNVVGEQILMDVKNINSNKLKTIEMIKPFMEKIIEELKLNVVDECSYQFKKDNLPFGATMIYLLAESQSSINTFVDEGKLTLDLFTCSLGVETEKIKSIIKDDFEVHSLNIDAYYFTRDN